MTLSSWLKVYEISRLWLLIHLTHHNFIDENGYQLSPLPPTLLGDSDCMATANQAMILLWLFMLGFELLAKWLLLSCYAANHLSLRVKTR